MTATANTAITINTDVKGKLSIESLQDSSQQSSSQTNVGGRVQVSFGTAWEASGSVSQNKGSGASQAVKEQSGLIAGEVGYHIRAETVDLKGGVIASINAKDSDLTTKAITFENIQNKVDYQASSVSMAGSIGGGSSSANGSSGNSSSQSSQTNVGGRVQVSFCTAWEAIHGYDDSCVNCAYKRGRRCGNSVASLTTI